MSNDAATTKTHFNPNEIEEVTESLADDQGARKGPTWVNPFTHQVLQSESEYENSKLRHYFTDRDEAISAWGGFANDPKVISKVGLTAKFGTTVLICLLFNLMFNSSKSLTIGG